jgi:hypothetical protein
MSSGLRLMYRLACGVNAGYRKTERWEEYDTLPERTATTVLCLGRFLNRSGPDTQLLIHIGKEVHAHSCHKSYKYKVLLLRRLGSM